MQGICSIYEPNNSNPISKEVFKGFIEAWVYFEEKDSYLFSFTDDNFCKKKYKFLLNNLIKFKTIFFLLAHLFRVIMKDNKIISEFSGTISSAKNILIIN